MISWFKKLWRDKRGSAIMIAGAALPMVVGAAGLASDTIQWTLWKRQLQRAADSAAIAGVYTRQAAKGSTDKVAAAVSHDLTVNNHNWMALKAGFPDVKFPDNDGIKQNQVKVTLAIQQPLPFSSMFMKAAPIITAVSTAAEIPVGGIPCFDATETEATTGLDFNGNAGIEAPDCDGFSNAAGANTSAAGGSSDIKLKSIGGVGDIQKSDNFHVGAYRPYSPAIPDPFKDVTPNPGDMKCAQASTTTATNPVKVIDTPEQGHFVTKGKKETWVVDVPEVSHYEYTYVTSYGEPLGLSDANNGNLASLTDSSGNTANCFTSISVGSGQTLTLADNTTYYINGGDLDVKGTLKCDACTIVLTNKKAGTLDPKAGETIGNIKVNASANINMTAPTTGTFKGIALYQDRRAPDCKNCNKINGNSGSIIQGAIYFPSRELEYNGTGTTDAICTMFIGRRLKFSGNSTTTNKFKKLSECAAYGLPDGAMTTIVRLVG